MKRLFNDVTDGILSARPGLDSEFIMNYLLFSLKTLYFYYSSMVVLSIYDVLYIIGKVFLSSIEWCHLCTATIQSYTTIFKITVFVYSLSVYL